MARKAHFIRKTQGAPMPHRMFFVDTETEIIPLGKTETGRDRLEQRFQMGMCAYVRRKPQTTKFFTPRWFEIVKNDVEDFWDWVDKLCPLKTKSYMFAHNVSFDFPVL